MMVPVWPARASSRLSMSVMIPTRDFLAKAAAASTLGSMDPALK